MKTTSTPDPTSGWQNQKAARITGLFFLLNLIVPLINWGFILSGFKEENDILGTAGNIIENESLFRFGIAVELFMSVGLIILAVLLYKILVSVHEDLALLALSLKIAEATLMAVTVLIPFVALQFVNGNESISAFTQDQLSFPIGIIFNSHTGLTSIPMVFLGIDMMLFSYLFLKSRYIPGWISVFGILSFALIFIHALMFIIAPDYATIPLNQILFWTPSGMFEIIAGLWLIIKGIRI